MRNRHWTGALLGVAALVLCLPAFGISPQGAGKMVEQMKETGEFTPNTPKDKDMKDSPCKLYALKCVAGRTYTIDLSSDDFDAYLRLEDPSGKEVASDDDSGGGKSGLDARIVYKAPKSGTYTIAALALKMGKGKYHLAVAHNGAGSDKEITYLVEVRSKLTKDDPKDKGRGNSRYCKTYPIEMAAGKTYIIQLDSRDFDAYLRLVDQEGKEIANDDDGAMDGLNAKLTHKCDKSGTYSIVATTFAGPDTGEFYLHAHVKD